MKIIVALVFYFYSEINVIKNISVGWKPHRFKTVSFQDSNEQMEKVIDKLKKGHFAYTVQACGSATFDTFV